jgi:hypothetical protein
MKLVLTAALMGWMALSTSARADEVMPDSPPLTQTQMSAVLDELAKFIPMGEMTYNGHDPQGNPCQLGSDLEHTSQSGSFNFSPGINLAFGYPGSSAGDAVQFYLVNELEKTSPDGQQKSLHLVLINRGGFGTDRVVAYDLTATQGHLTSFTSSLDLVQGDLSPGEAISTFVPRVVCSF